MQTIDLISLWVGRFFIWLVILIFAIFVAHLLCKFFLEPIWITFKHLLPPFHFKESLIDEWVKRIANVNEDDWYFGARLYKKGRFVLMYWGHKKNPFAKIEMGLIKKK